MTSPIFKNFTKDPNLEEFCPDGKPRADCQTCPESQLIRHDPPLVHDLYRDPYELYPLVDTGDKGVVARILAKVGRILVEHLDSIVDCCNPPLCKCNLLSSPANRGVGRILVEHLDSIVDVPPQLGHFSKAVNPVFLSERKLEAFHSGIVV
uniref:Uncharacterized protein n=1 Tax=Meloidogyne floridensis TaxID=298350 RepID=A0A915NQH2_9BILA